MTARRLAYDASGYARSCLAVILGGLLLTLSACGPLQPAQDPPTYREIGGRGGSA